MSKLAVADTWVILDDVQFVLREWQNRCWVHPTRPERPRFKLTVPVHRRNGRASAIREVELVDPERASRQLLLSALHAYRASRFWPDVDEIAQSIADRIRPSLLETAKGSAEVALGHLHAPPLVAYASDLAAPGPASARLALLAVRAGATHYVAGPGSRAYMRVEEFERRGVTVLWQAWQHDADACDVGAGAGAGAGDWSYLDYVARYGRASLIGLLQRIRATYRARCARLPEVEAASQPLR